MEFWPADDEAEGTGPVASVSVSELRSAWARMRDLPEEDQPRAIGLQAFEAICAPGTDVRALWYRAAMLYLLSRRMGILSPWLHRGELDEAVFQVAATFPMKKIVVGEVRQGLPFDVQEFLRQVNARSAGT